MHRWRVVRTRRSIKRRGSRIVLRRTIVLIVLWCVQAGGCSTDGHSTYRPANNTSKRTVRLKLAFVVAAVVSFEFYTAWDWINLGTVW